MILTCVACQRDFAINIFETNTEGPWVCRYCLEKKEDNQ